MGVEVGVNNSNCRSFEEAANDPKGETEDDASSLTAVHKHTCPYREAAYNCLFPLILFLGLLSYAVIEG